jgi:hypothetical protein
MGTKGEKGKEGKGGWVVEWLGGWRFGDLEFEFWIWDFFAVVLQ